MSKSRRKKLMWRLSFVSAGLIAVCLTAYSLFGPVPTGLGLSRWWDILIGPIWCSLLVWLLTTDRRIGKEFVTPALFIGPLLGLILAIPATSPREFLVLGLLVSMCAFSFGVITGLEKEVIPAKAVLAGGLAFALPIALSSGLLAGLFLTTTFFLCFGLSFFLLANALKEIWKAVWPYARGFFRWLRAEEED